MVASSPTGPSAGLLASATPRRTIVIAKALVIAAWGIAISAWVLLLSLAIGWLIGLPDWSGSAAIQALATIAFAALLTIALQGMTAFFAGVGHGYIAPLAWAVATVAASQVLAVLGWGAWFPWAVPAILAGAGGVAVEPVGPGGIAMVILAAAVGIIATVTWWERADQTG